jgi:hypothetical protein
MAQPGADSGQPRPDFPWVDVWSPSGAFFGGTHELGHEDPRRRIGGDPIHEDDEPETRRLEG